MEDTKKIPRTMDTPFRFRPVHITKNDVLKYHAVPRPGKLEVVPTKPYSSRRDLSMAYSPGVAYASEAISQAPGDVYRYTDKGNLVAVISNGTAVLGLGNIGPEAGKPVMEGKALLFKVFADIDCFDIELNSATVDSFVTAVKAMAPTFGAVCLEDIKAPECFEIEQRLRDELPIPVMHDDQHGTAVVAAAGLINALYIQGKNIRNVRVVVSGAGAAAMACTDMFMDLGVNPANVVMCDSKGVISMDRADISGRKRRYATSRKISTLAEAMVDADVFLGLSVGGVLSAEMLASMAPDPIVFALANPEPEIEYSLAVETRPDMIMATGRSDLPNQINNVLGFPYIFRAALDVRAAAINRQMEIAAAHAIADLAREDVPETVCRALGVHELKFGRNYIIPAPFDHRLLTTVTPAVARAAQKSGVAGVAVPPTPDYIASLCSRITRDAPTMSAATGHPMIMARRSARKANGSTPA